jgi:flagellar biosynthesis repressor protein FlbT
MPLLIHIKPGESLFIGMGSITNRSEHRTHLEINGTFPWLHQKEVMQETEATSPCKRLYLTIQTMYLAEDAEHLPEAFHAQVREIQRAAGTAPYLKNISNELQAGRHHKALKEAHRLIEHEAESAVGAKRD